MRHDFLDQHTHLDSTLHRLDPRAKLVGFCLAVLIVAATPTQLLHLFSGYYALILALVVLSRVPLLHFARRPTPGGRVSAFSAGISGVPWFTREADLLYRQADAALYWAKRHGRGCVEVFDTERDQLPDNLIDATRNAVQEVLSSGLLIPVFQPIVDLRTGRILGFEGLIRPDPRGPLPDTAVTASIRDSSFTHVTSPAASISTSQIRRCSAPTSGVATKTLMPLPMAAGVLGIARTTAASAPKCDLKKLMVLPARIDRKTGRSRVNRA